jgi:hypothetical protein
LQQAFGELSPDELVNLEQSLRRLREVLTGARHNTKEPA